MSDFRWDEEKETLARMMELLITLFYSEDTKTGKCDDLTEKSINLIKELSLFLSNSDSGYKKHGEGIISINSIYLDDWQLSIFNRIMRNFEKNILSGKLQHFHLIDVSESISSNVSIKVAGKSIQPLGWKDANKINRKSVTSIYYKKPNDIDNLFEINKPFVIAKREVVYTVGHLTDFGKRIRDCAFDKNKRKTYGATVYRGAKPADNENIIMEKRKNIGPLTDATFEIKPTLMAKADIITFIGLVRSILINFHIVMNGYERIRTCTACQKLIVINRTTKRNCDDKCRAHSNHEQEGTDRRKCRKRQNQWLHQKYNEKAKEKNNNITKTPWSVPKDKCVDCETFPSGGECKVLQENNKELLPILRKNKVVGS